MLRIDSGCTAIPVPDDEICEPAKIGTGTADTSAIIRVKTSAARPARERIYECIPGQPIEKKKRKEGTPGSYIQLIAPLKFCVGIKPARWQLDLIRGPPIP